MQSLLKLNSLRDQKYLQRTIPDLATFRKAYRLIKAWAKCRGVYASKLGYLGGFSITLLLARVCKLSFRETGASSTSDIIATFFSYYANFDWKNEMVYDVTFFKTKPKWIWTTTEHVWTKTIPVADVQTSSTVQTKTSEVPSTYTTSKPYPETSTKTEYSKTTNVWTKSVGSKCHPTKTECKTMTKYW